MLTKTIIKFSARTDVSAKSASLTPMHRHTVLVLMVRQMLQPALRCQRKLAVRFGDAVRYGLQEPRQIASEASKPASEASASRAVTKVLRQMQQNSALRTEKLRQIGPCVTLR